MTKQKDPRAWMTEFLKKSEVPYTENTLLQRGTTALIVAAFRIEFGTEPEYTPPVTVGELIRAFEMAVKTGN